MSSKEARKERYRAMALEISAIFPQLNLDLIGACVIQARGDLDTAMQLVVANIEGDNIANNNMTTAATAATATTATRDTTETPSPANRSKASTSKSSCSSSASASGDEFFIEIEPKDCAAENPSHGGNKTSMSNKNYDDVDNDDGDSKEEVVEEVEEVIEEVEEGEEECEGTDEEEEDEDGEVNVIEDFEDKTTMVDEASVLADTEKSSNQENNFVTLNEAGLIELQQQHIDKVHEVLKISAAFARILLQHFHWDSEKLLNRYFEHGMEKVYEQAGIVIPAAPATTTTTTTTTEKLIIDDEDFDCMGCLETTTFGNSIALGCGHRFCNDCWSAYLVTKIKRIDVSRPLRCMSFKCTAIVTDDVISRLFNKSDSANDNNNNNYTETIGDAYDKNDKDENHNGDLDKYSKKMLDIFVEESKSLRWCPGAGCGHAIYRVSDVAHEKGSLTASIAKCSNCSTKFCFKCGEEPHEPSSCLWFKRWKLQEKDDGQTVKWLSCNTKDCPKCGKAIEKNGGCNHMTCKCGAHFCWLCGRAITSYGHVCSRSKYSHYGSDEDRKSLGHYFHHFTRHQAHKISLQYLNRTSRFSIYQSVMARLLSVNSKEASQTLGVDTKLQDPDAISEWLEEALDVLTECRQLLMNSYIVTFFLYEEYVTPSPPSHKSSNVVPVELRGSSKNQLRQALVRQRMQERKEKKRLEAEAKRKKTVRQIDKNLFEDVQEQLETLTERLNDLLENKAPKHNARFEVKKKYQQKVVADTILGRSLMQNMRHIAQFALDLREY